MSLSDSQRIAALNKSNRNWRRKVQRLRSENRELKAKIEICAEVIRRQDIEIERLKEGARLEKVI